MDRLSISLKKELPTTINMFIKSNKILTMHIKVVRDINKLFNVSLMNELIHNITVGY